MERLYYLLYKEIKTTRKNDQSFFNAYMSLSFLIYINLGSVFGVLNYFLKAGISKDASVMGGLVVFGLVLFYNYFMLWRKKEDIVLKYDSKAKSNNRLLLWIFIVLSFVVFYLVLQYLV